MKYVTKHVASEIRAELARQRISGSALAAAIGISYPTLAPRLAGRREISVDLLALIAGELGVDQRDLLPSTQIHPDLIAAA